MHSRAGLLCVRWFRNTSLSIPYTMRVNRLVRFTPISFIASFPNSVTFALGKSGGTEHKLQIPSIRCDKKDSGSAKFVVRQSMKITGCP